MPPKRNSKRKNNNNLKKKKAIESRLMQISVKLDHHMYKNKTIWAAEARSYIQEISALQTQCGGDERLLQVIEKLTRCMNAIIVEQEDSNMIMQSQLVANKTYCPSPVYSLIDEEVAVPINNIKDNAQMDEKYETIDLTDSDMSPPKQMQVDVEIHRAMSNLSIRSDDPLKGSQNLCSQSILDDYNIIMSVANPNKTVNEAIMPTKVTRRIDDNQILKQIVTRNLTVDNNASIAKHGKNEPVHILRETVAKNIMSNAKTNYIKPNKNAGFNGNNIKSYTDANKNQIEEKNTKRRKINRKTNDCCKENKTLPKNKVGKTKAKGKQNKNSHDAKIFHENTSGAVTKPANNKLQNKTRSITPALNTRDVLKSSMNPDILSINRTDVIPLGVNSHLLQKIIMKASINTGTIDVRSKPVNNNLPRIYNSDIENDLSWAENIRYVREVNPSEYDPNFMRADSGFWENYDFPGSRDNKDWDLA